MIDKQYLLRNNIIFRKAGDAEVIAAANILKAAARQMIAEDKQQWDETYPTETHVRGDIERGVGYVLVRGDEVVAYCALIFDGEPAYEEPRCKWLSDEPYVVAHRVAVKMQCWGEGLGKLMLETAGQFAVDCGVHSFRVDTNYNNYSMLSLLEKLGFKYCGEVTYLRGVRKAFEKLLK